MVIAWNNLGNARAAPDVNSVLMARVSDRMSMCWKFERTNDMRL